MKPPQGGQGLSTRQQSAGPPSPKTEGPQSASEVAPQHEDDHSHHHSAKDEHDSHSHRPSRAQWTDDPQALRHYKRARSLESASVRDGMAAARKASRSRTSASRPHETASRKSSRVGRNNPRLADLSRQSLGEGESASSHLPREMAQPISPGASIGTPPLVRTAPIPGFPVCRRWSRTRNAKMENISSVPLDPSMTSRFSVCIVMAVTKLTNANVVITNEK